MEFFDRIYGSTQRGWVSVTTKNQETGALDQQRWFFWPRDKGIIKKYVSLRDFEDVYFSVGIFSDKKRTSEDPGAFTNLVWVDADTCPPEKFKVEPTLQVETSPGRWHCMWMLDHTYPAHEVQDIARAISYAHREDGCDMGWTSSKILRVPGTTNTKYNLPYEVKIKKDTERVFSPEEIEDVYPPSVADGETLNDLGDIPKIKLTPQMEQELVSANGLESLFLEVPKQGQSWSERLRRLELELFRAGATIQDVFNVCWASGCNKYHPKYAGYKTQEGVPIPKRSDPKKALWRDVSKAYATYQAEQNVILDEPSTYVTHMSLLSLDERRKIKDNPSFLDAYVDWAKSRSPDHAGIFSYSFACQILSCAYGDRLRIDALWDKGIPNLWTFIGAGSTRNHKSTARNLFLNFISELELRNDENIVVANDFTIEKLISVLGTRDKQVSLIDVDEIQGWFQSVVAQKYRSGSYATLSNLYDGNVPIVLRATEGRGNTAKAKTVLNFVGVGIFDQIANALTEDEFESGFMLRSTWAVADAPPYSKGDGDWQVSDVDEYEEELDDEVFFNLVSRISDNQSRADRDNPITLRWSEEARKRLDQFTHEVSMYAIESGEHMIQPYAERLRNHVATVAALLAFHEQNTKIELFNVQVAISQGERWLKSFEKLLTQVSSSDFARRCDQLESYIASGSKRRRLESAIFQKFSYRLGEFSEIRNTLQKQGRIRSAGNQTWEAL